ncbi:molybdenum cofactor biosynthesis protein MoaE [Sphingomonas quercus]|uniref:Molybdenum cofactor biosynthesis protein MoaE n=1 Tax=Sphingomonas quercus TaxID=2842451 RepID=A0ABS6BLQ1_9SPHN|nr:molybdenum cofactor biosynthesis protein MoaE [Sphingomonas quercus]MBU3079235.1 molybdenum cofactor biosynthesis protein MoaE [Sphingomonas quercus]
MIRLADAAIDPGALLAEFCAGRTDAGAVVSFTGLTRGRTDGAAVTRLTLDAYPGFTEAVMAEIEAEARARFAVEDVLAVHRWGSLDIGEPIIFVAAAAEHRRAAFEAVDYLMDQFKTRAPFWKREDGPDGARWIEARPDDHQAIERWATAQ